MAELRVKLVVSQEAIDKLQAAEDKVTRLSNELRDAVNEVRHAAWELGGSLEMKKSDG